MSHEDAAGPTLPPVSDFTSPFLQMITERIATCLRTKIISAETDSATVSDQLFIIVDKRIVEDSTYWLGDIKNWKNEEETSIVEKVRARMVAASLAMINLEIANLLMKELVRSAQRSIGIWTM